MDKINKTKAGGKLVDATAAMEADFKNDLDKVAKVYNSAAAQFSNPAIDPTQYYQAVDGLKM